MRSSTFISRRNVKLFARLNQADLESNCWMVVHQHRHGMFPSEYDIREIDEDLYLALLAHCRA